MTGVVIRLFTMTAAVVICIVLYIVLLSFSSFQEFLPLASQFLFFTLGVCVNTGVIFLGEVGIIVSCVVLCVTWKIPFCQWRYIVQFGS